MNIAQQVVNTTHPQIKKQLIEQGWVLLRNEHYDVTSFSELMNGLCQRLTYDPARENITRQSQKVDAGTQAMGLHIENGSTPLPPDIIAFYSEKSASRGSQTTLCDGHEVWKNLPDALQQKFAEPMTISRYLPKPIWQKYVATALQIEDTEQVGIDELERFIQMVPGQRISPAHDDGVQYQLSMPMVRHDNLKGVPAFANTLLGPSYNYEKPHFYFADGSEISPDLLLELAERCEARTSEINWQDGDLVIIDNKRFMHGRREILVPLEQRKLYICMGLGLNPAF
jgi:alpha-ketoglutarate-dependent taurine dioxygenase